MEEDRKVFQSSLEPFDSRSFPVPGAEGGWEGGRVLWCFGAFY